MSTLLKKFTIVAFTLGLSIFIFSSCSDDNGVIPIDDPLRGNYDGHYMFTDLAVGDSGDIKVNGKSVYISSPEDARAAGIETVFQDLAMIPEFDIVENLFLNREIKHKNPILRWLGWLDTKAMTKRARKSLNRLNTRIPSYTEQIHNLSGGQRQAIAIARAVNWGADIVIMDEPTAALGVEQSAQVNDLIKVISSQGVAVLLISHNMQHVVETCDRAVVLYQGSSVADVAVPDVTKEDLVGLITGAKEIAA